MRNPIRKPASRRAARTVDVVVVGSIGLDTIETPFEKRRDLLGGSVSYACAASAFLSSVGMVGVVGTDFPPACRDVYRRFGIDLEGLALVAGKTFRWSGIYEADMINRRTISTELNVFERFSPELPASYAKAPFFLLGNISPELQLRVLQQAQSPVFVVADTMDLWIRMARKPLNQVIRRVHMLMLNDAEARQLTGRYNLVECARDILAMGPRYVVIKKGEHGAMLVSKAGVFLVPAYPVDVVRDPTGAGDSFAGGFLGALAQARAGGRGAIRESEVRQALLYGSVIASFNVEDFSLNRLQVLKRSDVEARLRQLKQMMSVT